jgi:integrase
MAARVKRLLSDGMIEAVAEFAEGQAKIIFDTKISGLRLRAGKHRISWTYFAEHRIHGKRSTTCQVLGHFPSMNTAGARQAALIIAGRNASGRIAPGKRTAVKFETAFSEYLKYLETKAARAGKPARWAVNVRKLGRLLLPEFGRWPLADLSNSPAVIRDWHVKITGENGPVSANHAAKIVRAIYKHASKLNRSLPPALPTSAVVYNEEVPRETGLAFTDFPKWADTWRKIESPIRRSYHLTALLTGARPGELARLKWSDVKPKARAIVIGRAKAGLDITIPLSVPIAQALRMARDADKPRGLLPAHEGLVFPGCAHGQNVIRDALPAHGNMLRHVYRSVAAGLKPPVDDLLIHFLMGHKPRGISQRYVSRLMLSSGSALRGAQRSISKRIVALLKLPD